MYDIVRYSTGSLFWGFLIGVLLIGLFLFLLEGFKRGALRQPLSWIMSFFVGVLFIIQCLLFCVAWSVSSLGDDYEPALVSAVKQCNTLIDDQKDVVDKFIDQYPLVSHFVDADDYRGYSLSELPHAVLDDLRISCRWYMLRRVGWTMAFMLVGVFVSVKFMPQQYGSSSRRYNHGDSRHRHGVVTRNGRNIHRRR